MTDALVVLQIAVVEVFPHPAYVAPVEVPLSVVLHFLPASGTDDVVYRVVQGRLVADDPLPGGLALGAFAVFNAFSAAHSVTFILSEHHSNLAHVIQHEIHPFLCKMQLLLYTVYGIRNIQFSS